MADKFTDLPEFNTIGSDRTADVLAIVHFADDESQKITPQELQQYYIPRVLQTGAALDTTLRQMTDGAAAPNASQLYLATNKSAFAGSLSVGTTSAPGAVVDILGAGSTSATKGLQIKSSMGTSLLTVFDNGSTYFGSDTVNGSFVNLSGRFFVSQIGYRLDAGDYLSWEGSNRMWVRLANNLVQQHGIFYSEFGGGAVEASARLQITSTSQGFLPPRMTTTQKNNISSPATGLVVYDTTLNKLCLYTGGGWETVTSA